MSIIQSIRDKAAWIIIAAIALALIAFIVQDAFQNRNMFGGSSDTIGEVNGTKIKALDFEERVKRAEEMYSTQGYPMNDMMRNNIRESLWGEYVDDAIMKDRYTNLGIAVSDRELRDGILYGANPPQDLKQQFTDKNTGLYDANAAYQAINELKKQKNSPQYKSFYEQYLPALAKNRQKEKYVSLLANSSYAPKWMVEKINADNTQKAAISFVFVPYSTVNDSTIKISDESVKSYINEHKDNYKQEATRSIQYVMFDAGPTTADSAAIRTQVESLKNEFATTTDINAFLVRNGSEKQYTDAYQLKSKITSQFKDSITKMADGQVMGPYIEGGNYMLAKIIERRNMPDSVKVRHILIKTEDQGKPVLADSTAKQRIDSIVNAIKGGANFGEMVVKYTDDQGSKDKGGEYDFTSSQFSGISKEFAETAFYGVTGDKKTVKVQNNAYAGYHYIEVISQKGFEPAYKLAEFARAIVPSDETTSKENGLAAQFAAESRDKKSFDANIKKYNYTPLVATDLKPLDAMVMGLGSSRELIKWVYQAEPGDISEQPFQVEDKFVVPMLTRVYEEGTMSVEKARPLVESILRNQQKAKQITAKIGNAATIEAAATNTAQQVLKSDSVMFSATFVPNVGQEPKVIGASFNKSNQSKVSAPIPGNGGVFVVKVDNISAVPGAADIEQQKASLMQNMSRGAADPRMISEILKKTAKIKDNRYKFF
jgi:peptidyl-prolyl cis-trans isomerase D